MSSQILSPGTVLLKTSALLPSGGEIANYIITSCYFLKKMQSTRLLHVGLGSVLKSNVKNREQQKTRVPSFFLQRNVL